MPLFSIERSLTIEVNTDPQRRCYNGCHYKSEMVRTAWGVLESDIPEGKIESRLEFWRGLTSYAVSQRGKSAHIDYRSVIQVEENS